MPPIEPHRQPRCRWAYEPTMIPRPPCVSRAISPAPTGRRVVGTTKTAATITAAIAPATQGRSEQVGAVVRGRWGWRSKSVQHGPHDPVIRARWLLGRSRSPLGLDTETGQCGNGTARSEEGADGTSWRDS